MRGHNDYLDPSRHEPSIGPLEEKFCEMLEDFQAHAEAYGTSMPMDGDGGFAELQKRHDEMIAFVADLELKLTQAEEQIGHMHACPHVDRGVRQVCADCEKFSEIGGPVPDGSETGVAESGTGPSDAREQPCLRGNGWCPVGCCMGSRA